MIKNYQKIGKKLKLGNMLFLQKVKNQKEFPKKKLMNVIDNMNAAYRNDVLKFGTSSTKKNWKMRSEKRSKRYTTRWDELCEVQ